MIRKRQQLKGSGNQQHKPMIRNKQGSQQKKKVAITNIIGWLRGGAHHQQKNDDQKEATITNIRGQ